MATLDAPSTASSTERHQHAIVPASEKFSVSANELVFELDAKSRCLWINERVRKSFGDVTGQNIREIFSNEPEVLKQYQRLANGQEFIYFEVPEKHAWLIQGIRSDGKLSGAVITGQPVDTPSSRVHLAPTAWRYNCNTKCFTVSAPFALLFGLKRTEINVNEAPEQFPPQLEMLMSACNKLLEKKAEFVLKEFQATDVFGETRWLSLRGQIAEQNNDSEVLGINGSIEDISERITENMNRQDLELKMLRVQKMEAIGELAGGIAHDFNNILTSVMGYTELALMELPPTAPKLATYLQEIYQGGRRARELVAKMLTFSRTDQIQPENFDLMQEVKDIVKMLRASLPSSIEIRIDIDEGLPEVCIDKSFLQQMIMNTCINARDAMPEGGSIHMRGRSRIVKHDHCDSCHGDFAGDFVELSIEDTGTGIRQEVMDRLFEPYVSTKDGGSGMGLAMVHGIMHRQGGHIKVDSLYNDGTEFRFFLRPADNYGIMSVSEPIAEIQKSAQENRHILVVDDEVSLVYFLRELLQKKGYKVSVASDSHEAWDLFSAAPEEFDLVVTDQTMPGLSGVQLSAKMLTLRDDLPIILCTGYSDVVDESNIAQYGIQSYMAKPIDSKEFLRSVEELLRIKQPKDKRLK